MTATTDILNEAFARGCSSTALTGETPKTGKDHITEASSPTPNTPKPAKPPTTYHVGKVSPVEPSGGLPVVMDEMDL